MNIEDMRAWIATFENGSLQQASLKLSLTQPAVTRRIQRLEESLGVTLLNRNSKPARPTSIGEKVYRDCLRIVRETDALQRRTQDYNQLSGDLRIGVSFGVMESILGPAIDRLRNTYPDIRLHVTGGRNIELIPLINQYRLDAAIIVVRTGHLPEGVTDSILLGQETVSVFAQRKEGFSDEIELGELAGHRWIINPDGCAYRKQLETALRDRKIALEVAVETWGIPFLISLVARGMGLGLTTARSVLNSTYAEELQVLKIKGFEASLEVRMIRSESQSQLNPILDFFTECTRDTLRDT